MDLVPHRPVFPSRLVPTGVADLVDELLSASFPPLGPLSRLSPPWSSPAAQLSSDGDELVLRVELAGFAPDDVSVVLDQGTLDVTATAAGLTRRVRAELPGVDPTSVRAGMESGLLELRMSPAVPVVVPVAAQLPAPLVPGPQGTGTSDDVPAGTGVAGTGTAGTPAPGATSTRSAPAKRQRRPPATPKG